MKWYEIIIIIFIALFVLTVFLKAFIDHKNGKSSCGGGCLNCDKKCSLKYESLKEVYDKSK